MLRMETALLLALATNTFNASALAQSAVYRFRIYSTSPSISETLVARSASGARLFERQTIKGVSTCILVQGSTHTVISDPKGKFTRCTGLGSNGGVVGYYNNGSALPPYSGFAYYKGTYVDVAPGSASSLWGSTVNAVSPKGLMCGGYQASDGSYPIFVTYGSSYNIVQLGGVLTLICNGINDGGTIVAQELFATMRGTQEYSVMIVNGVASPVAFPGSVATYANNINDKGDVVGYYYNADYLQHGFIYSSSQNAYYGPIDVIGAVGTSLTGITNDDVITGSVLFPGAQVSQAIIGNPTAPNAVASRLD